MTLNRAEGFPCAIQRHGGSLRICSQIMSFISGVDGIDGDGDVYKPDNLREFRKFVLESTDGRGVHFVMADGVCSIFKRGNFKVKQNAQMIYQLNEFIIMLGVS